MFCECFACSVDLLFLINLQDVVSVCTPVTLDSCFTTSLPSTCPWISCLFIMCQKDVFFIFLPTFYIFFSRYVSIRVSCLRSFTVLSFFFCSLSPSLSNTHKKNTHCLFLYFFFLSFSLTISLIIPFHEQIVIFSLPIPPPLSLVHFLHLPSISTSSSFPSSPIIRLILFPP